MAEPDESPPAGAHGAAPSRRDLLVALVHGAGLDAAVAAALDVVERDPLATAGCFRGDLLRGLMEVPGCFWGRAPALYDRYRRALRAGAERRRRLPACERMEFWSRLDAATLEARAAERPGDGVRRVGP